MARGNEIINRRPPNPAEFRLPTHPFLYTLDQVAGLLEVNLSTLDQWVYYDGRQHNTRTREYMIARNIALVDERPVWRIAEQELLRWLQVKGFKMYRGRWITH